jgi:hypothetical protein
MVCIQPSSVAAHPPSHVMWEKVTVIWTLNVLEHLSVDQTTVEQIIRRWVVTGMDLLIAVLVVSHTTSNMFM